MQLCVQDRLDLDRCSTEGRMLPFPDSRVASTLQWFARVAAVKSVVDSNRISSSEYAARYASRDLGSLRGSPSLKVISGDTVFLWISGDPGTRKVLFNVHFKRHSASPIYFEKCSRTFTIFRF